MRFAPLTLALVAGLVLFTGLARMPWTDVREARDAAVARALIADREPLTPRFAGEPHFEKPLPAYAPEVMVALTSGEDRAPQRSRAVRAVLAVALIALVASIGAEHFGARAGWLAALSLATSLGLPLAARTDGTQLLATLLGWVGLAGFADATFGRAAGRTARLVVAWGGIAAGLMVGGPLTALWPLGAVAFYAALIRRPGVLGAVRPWAGLAIAAGLALPWTGAMVERHGAAFAAAWPFFPYAVETRGPWWSGLPLAAAFLVVNAFPWIALLAPAMTHAATWWRPARRPMAWRAAGGAPHGGPEAAGEHSAPPAPGAPPDAPVARERREEHAAHFFIAALLAALVPVALYAGPPLPAALPALPAASLLIGRFLDHLIEDAERLAAPAGRAFFTAGATGSVLAVALTALATRLRDMAPDVRLLAAITLVASWAPFLASFMGRRRLAALLVAAPVAIGAPLVHLRLMPAAEGLLSARDVAEAMNQASPPLAPLLAIETPPPSLGLYLHRNLVVTDQLAAALVGQRASDGLAYVAFRPGREREVARAAPGPLEIVLRTQSLVLARVHPVPGP